MPLSRAMVCLLIEMGVILPSFLMSACPALLTTTLNLSHGSSVRTPLNRERSVWAVRFPFAA